MPRLTSPDVRFHASFLAAVREFTETDLDAAALLGEDVGGYARTWGEPEGFAALVDTSATRSAPAPGGRDTPPPCPGHL